MLVETAAGGFRGCCRTRERFGPVRHVEPVTVRRLLPDTHDGGA
jgi:hypothetical protein